MGQEEEAIALGAGDRNEHELVFSTLVSSKLEQRGVGSQAPGASRVRSHRAWAVR